MGPEFLNYTTVSDSVKEIMRHGKIVGTPILPIVSNFRPRQTIAPRSFHFPLLGLSQNWRIENRSDFSVLLLKEPQPLLFFCLFFS